MDDQVHTFKASTFWESCRHAWHGIASAFQGERNFRIQVVIAVLVLLAGFFLGFSPTELALLVLVVALVLVSEMINTAAELLADVVQPDYHQKIALLKDITAGSVLVASIVAVLIGLLLFGPALLALVR